MRSISSRGWELLVETDTNDALARFHKGAPFDAVISDLGPQEGGKYDPDAGLSLLREVRSTDRYVPVLIYTSEDAASSRGKELADASATMVTASPIALQQGLARSVGIAFERRALSQYRRFAHRQGRWAKLIGAQTSRRLSWIPSASDARQDAWILMS